MEERISVDALAYLRPFFEEKIENFLCEVFADNTAFFDRLFKEFPWVDLTSCSIETLVQEEGIFSNSVKTNSDDCIETLAEAQPDDSNSVNGRSSSDSGEALDSAIGSVSSDQLINLITDVSYWLHAEMEKTTSRSKGLRCKKMMSNQSYAFLESRTRLQLYSRKEITMTVMIGKLLTAISRSQNSLEVKTALAVTGFF